MPLAVTPPAAAPGGGGGGRTGSEGRPDPGASPQACWDAILAAMRMGDPKAVEALCTPAGYRSLLPSARTGEDAGARLRSLGRLWGDTSRYAARWQPPAGDSFRVVLGPPAPAMSGLEFRRASGRWLLERWTPGR